MLLEPKIIKIQITHYLECEILLYKILIYNYFFINLFIIIFLFKKIIFVYFNEYYCYIFYDK